MAEPHVVSALREKLSRLKGERDKLHLRMVALRVEIASVETCLGMFAQDLGMQETERNLANKISRGGFTAAFLIQCLDAIGTRSVHLQDS